MSFHRASHPLWSAVRLATLMGALTAILYITATRFDESEIKTIVYTFLAAASGEGVIAGAKAFLGNRAASVTRKKYRGDDPTE